MIVDSIRRVIAQEQGSNPLFIRTRIKEAIQDYILHFVYNHTTYKTFIFTGGTCLRKLYGLPRLSEDVDFDTVTAIDMSVLAQDIKKYFIESQQYKNVETKIAGREQTIFIKFPDLMTDLGIARTKSDVTMLFVRMDIAQEALGMYGTEVRPITTSQFTFFVNAYDLSTLFTNKMTAFLRRDFFKGKTQIVAFKGRDVYDLVWFFERRQKSGEPKLRWDRLLKALDIETQEKVIKKFLEKIQSLDPGSVRRDLEPFIASSQEAFSFSEHFVDVLVSGAQELGEEKYAFENWVLQ